MLEYELEVAKKVTDKLKTFYKKFQLNGLSCILGHIILSPPIRLGIGSSDEGYTEDWVIIKVDSSKINKSNFMGNSIGLGINILTKTFSNYIYPNTTNPPSFKYPPDCLLKVQGTISDYKMHHPAGIDQNKEPCLMVIKQGITTGITIGHANNIISYIQFYDNDIIGTSKEWSILLYNSKSGYFSDKGDLGSIIIISHKCMGGLTSGTGTSFSPITT